MSPVCARSVTGTKTISAFPGEKRSPGTPSRRLYVAQPTTGISHWCSRSGISCAAHSYVALKRSLAQRFRTDRAAYTAAKTTFIDDVVAKALSESSLRGDG
ncbi:GrpB family protein [Amycolatopsis sp. NPDC059090]|uniref:GrpB family protein n=1 Tax=unclassified Amycolatopsis TaxID=2618356 RepID=UPI00366C158D